MYRFLALLGVVDLEHPLTYNELKRLPVFRYQNAAKAFSLFGGLEFAFTLPGCWIPFIHWLWRIPTILASATMISREVEQRTWAPLRTTPFSVREIVYAKYAAIFYYMEPYVMLVIYIRAVPVIIFGASWMVSALTILPQRGLEYWFTITAALLMAGVYVLLSPVLDVAVDGAVGILASTMAPRRSTTLVIAMLARLTGWLLPLALAAPLQYGAFTDLWSGTPPDMITLRAVAVVSTFGPGYAFLWGVPAWLSVGLVIGFILGRLGLVRLLLEFTVIRAARIETL